MTRIALITAAALAMIGNTATAKTLATVNSDIGQVVASAKTGLTLYTFRNDAKNASNCGFGRQSDDWWTGRLPRVHWLRERRAWHHQAQGRHTPVGAQRQAAVLLGRRQPAR